MQAHRDPGARVSTNVKDSPYHQIGSASGGLEDLGFSDDGVHGVGSHGIAFNAVGSSVVARKSPTAHNRCRGYPAKEGRARWGGPPCMADLGIDSWGRKGEYGLIVSLRREKPGSSWADQNREWGFPNEQAGTGTRMSGWSKIEWTDSTWNPVRGCTKISPGCKHCYAETFAERFRGVSGHPYEQGFDLRLVPEKLTEPLSWSTPRMVFVNSMSDLFQDSVPDDYVVAVAKVMEIANWHTYQILTKRSGRMARMLKGKLKSVAAMPHIWWGVSVENRKHGLPRVADLRSAKARMKFLSVEPLLEDLGTVDLSNIDWVIVGGESGPGARPMREEWVQSVLKQCRSEGVPFFFKQWGGRLKKLNGRTLNGRTYDEVPLRPVPILPEKRQRVELARHVTNSICVEVV